MLHSPISAAPDGHRSAGEASRPRAVQALCARGSTQVVHAMAGGKTVNGLGVELYLLGSAACQLRLKQRWVGR